MVITLELPIRKNAPINDPLATYASRFGSVPEWFDEISVREARFLASKALRIGTPISAADHLIF